MIPSEAAPLLWFTVAANALAIAFCVWCGIDLFRVRSKMVATAICLSVATGLSVVLVAMTNLSL